MAAVLESIKKDGYIRGIIPAQSVRVIAVQWIGTACIEITYKSEKGQIGQSLLYRDNESGLEIEEAGHYWSFNADGALFRLVVEAWRMRLASFFDPYLAIYTSLIDPLPHQISAVYETMLPRQPLRFLLADDPGAGKTIMAGLLIKELKARSDLERCMIVAPGSLVEQWQDELGQKFGLEFTIFSREMVEASRSGNPFEEHPRLIVRLDMLARSEDLQEKFQQAAEWDLIICDEAHRMSASYFGNEVHYTKRYRLGQKLGQRCRNFLLMSATPHNGKPDDFQLFMALLDGDRFEGRVRDGVHAADPQDMMRRLTKEELLGFDKRPLFPERRARTIQYALSPPEEALYQAVTDYVREEMNRVERFANKGEEKAKRNNVGFALQILQRRLASSPAAIHHSLQRRLKRLEEDLSEARLRARTGQETLRAPYLTHHDNAYHEDIEAGEDYTQDDLDDMEERISTQATAARTVAELAIEVETLRKLEEQARKLLESGEDRKWVELQRILNDDLMRDEDGNYRKLIIFTEAKDTLFYLRDKIINYIGRPEAVDVIYGGVTREERRKVIGRFMQDRTLRFLIANDAAGEGVNLQRGHLMVNYDLPWNPNKIEQRFGRIHRIGQTEICHLWNLVAADTREGAVYARLLEKLEAARKVLKDRVYDVLGELFEGTSLRDLLCEAIQYGDERRDRLFQVVDEAVDQSHLMDLLKRRALTDDTMSAGIVTEIRDKMEQAGARRLQPHHVQSYFVAAFQLLGGIIKPREEGRWEITYVPAVIREQDRQTGQGDVVGARYERVCFDKAHINRQPVATFLYPGHPLLEAVTSVIRERHGTLLKQGAIMVDETDSSTECSVIFLLESTVRDGGGNRHDQPEIISRQLQFVGFGQEGAPYDAGLAPHLNLRPATAEEMALVQEEITAGWDGQVLEGRALDYATMALSRQHVREVQERRLPELEKVEREVKARLRHEINAWDSRAAELEEAERRGGKSSRLNAQNARRRAEGLAERLRLRMAQLEKERMIQAMPPRICGGMIVIPQGYIQAARSDAPSTHAQEVDQAARCRVEQAAMEAVMAAERRLGNIPEDVSAQRKIGYDILSRTPDGDLRPIEVKGRIEGADTIMISRNELLASLYQRERFVLALVSVSEDGIAGIPRYCRGALMEHEPGFEMTAIQFNMAELLKKASDPA